GIERLVLDFGQRAAHAPFFERMIAPVAGAASSGRNTNLCQALGSYLDSEAVNARTDDDKTLILAARR
ncbi:protein phosphatase 2C domain-containing protein, partial [Salmonella enterica]